MRTPHNRQLNVQQQNAVIEESQACEIAHWRNSPAPLALRTAALQHGLDWSKLVVLDLEINYPGMPNLFGMLLTGDERFIRFYIDADERHEIIFGIDCWEDVTDQQNLNKHNPGIGMGKGAIAIKLLRQFNASDTNDN